MPVNDADFKTLQDRVREIDAAISGLKFAAAALGLTGAVLAALLLWVSRTAWDANSTAENAKRNATAVAASVDIATKDSIYKIKTATDDGIKRIGTPTQVAETSISQGISRIASAESDAKEHLQSYFVAPFLTPEMDWAQDGPPTDLHVKDGEGVCFLTRVTRVIGRLRVHEEEVKIAVQDGEYVLTGASSPCCVVATARCLRFKQPLQGSSP